MCTLYLCRQVIFLLFEWYNPWVQQNWVLLSNDDENNWEFKVWCKLITNIEFYNFKISKSTLLKCQLIGYTSSACLASLVSRYLTVLHETMKTKKTFFFILTPIWVQFSFSKQVIKLYRKIITYMLILIHLYWFSEITFFCLFFLSLNELILEECFQNSFKIIFKWWNDLCIIIIGFSPKHDLRGLRGEVTKLKFRKNCEIWIISNFNCMSGDLLWK
jgi:hypothetical protein